jgi:hypothetical protein
MVAGRIGCIVGSAPRILRRWAADTGLDTAIAAKRRVADAAARASSSKTQTLHASSHHGTPTGKPIEIRSEVASL